MWRRLATVVLVLLLAVGAGLVGLRIWLGSDDLRARVEQQAAAALGLPVTIGKISISLWPLPAVALERVVLQTQAPIQAELLAVRPQWADLLAGQWAPASVVARGVQLTQSGLEQLQAKQAPQAQQAQQARTAAKPMAGASRPPPTAQPTAPQVASEATGAAGHAVAQQTPPSAYLPRRLVLENIRFTDAKGATHGFDGDVRLGTDAMPTHLALRLTQGPWQGSSLGLSSTRADAGLAWNVDASVAGGNIRGSISWQQVAAGHLVNGQLETRDVDVAMATRAATGKPAVLSGKLTANTTLRAQFSRWAQAGEALKTDTPFTIRSAVLHGIDLARAVKTVGLSRGGETRLDTLQGQFRSQGQAMQLDRLEAQSGLLSATGHVSLAPLASADSTKSTHRLNGQVQVALAGTAGSVGVPLEVGGTLQQPEVRLTRAAMIGAAVGTVIAPGVGTGAGASVGGSLGEKLKGLFSR